MKKWTIVSKSFKNHQARCCHVMTTCFSRSKLVFAAKLAMSRGARYLKRGRANQNRNRVQRKNRMCKFKNRLGKMMSCDIYFHNPIPSSGQQLERRRRRCGTLGEANQKRKPDRMKTSLNKFKNRFGNMLACDVYFHNLISSSGERA